MSEAFDGARFVGLFETMLAIRRFEEAVQRLYDDGDFRGHYHLYTGQEATGAAVIAALDGRDTIFSTHRNHGHLIALGGDPAAALAEILGRVDGVGGGRLGTFHLADPARGMPHTSALVGGCVPLAAGSAIAAKLKKTGGISVAFFGDGAFEEGVVFETLNLARLWKLPVLFVCENNTPGALTKAQGGSNTSYLPHGRVASVPEALGIPTYEVDWMDIESMDALARDAVARVRKDGAPVFIEALTVRWPGNQSQFPKLVTGVTDIAMAWDASLIGNEHTAWFEKDDPVLRAARLLLEAGAADRAALQAIDASQTQRMEAARVAALASPLPDPATACDHVFAGGAA
jgi:TPP-dependent pyruvate/acetoin dehydrogenase alpha subunit